VFLFFDGDEGGGAVGMVVLAVLGMVQRRVNQRRSDTEILGEYRRELLELLLPSPDVDHRKSCAGRASCL